MGSRLGEDLYKTEANKYTIGKRYCIYTQVPYEKKDPIFIQYIKCVCKVLAWAGFIVNSERDSPLVEKCLSDCTRVTLYCIQDYRIKTTDISDSNQAQVQHSHCFTHRHNIKTNTVLKPTQRSVFFFSSYRDALGFFHLLHTTNTNLLRPDAHRERPFDI